MPDLFIDGMAEAYVAKGLFSCLPTVLDECDGSMSVVQEESLRPC